MVLTTEEKSDFVKMVYPKIEKLSRVKFSIEAINTLFGTPIRAGIILILNEMKELNKLELLESLKLLKIETSYKNLLWSLDKLHEEGLVIFEKRRQQNNAVFVKLNEEKVQQELKLFLASMMDMVKVKVNRKI